jgi:hypothetical protein
MVGCAAHPEYHAGVLDGTARIEQLGPHRAYLVLLHVEHHSFDPGRIQHFGIVVEQNNYVAAGDRYSQIIRL